MYECIKKTNKQTWDLIVSVFANPATYLWVFGILLFIVEMSTFVYFMETHFPRPGPLLGFSSAFFIVVVIMAQGMYLIALYDNCSKKATKSSQINNGRDNNIGG